MDGQPPDLPFAVALRHWRLARALTQEELAERAGLSARAISDLERGVRQHPQLPTVRTLVAALGLAEGEAAAFLAAATHQRGTANPTASASGGPDGASGRERVVAAAGLPRPLTSFVGHGPLVQALEKLVVERPLVTLIGAGGVGKTRLALEVATALQPAFTDGVWLVDLAPIIDPALVLVTVAATLGLSERPDEPLQATLTRSLQPRHMLLLLDNCEHLIDASASAAEALVSAGLGVRVLATSREALGITGEGVQHVPSLAVPPSEELPAPVLARGEAVRLFLDRAGSVRPTFVLTEQNAAAVARICRALDGIPLALELAARRLGGMTAEQVAGRLDRCFQMLTDGSRTALARQRTLRATIDWSYQLLDEREQLLFVRLSIFVGGWTLAAAEAVCSGGGIEPAAVLDLLAQLVEKSLVIADWTDQRAAAPAPESAARYRLLETLRQYGAETLASDDGTAAVAERHAAYFLALTEPLGADPLWVIPPPVGTLALLDVERDNLRAAMGWWLRRGAAEGALRQAVPLFPRWFWQGYLEEGCRVLEEALALPSGAMAAEVRLAGVAALANLARRRRDYTRASALFLDYLEYAVAVGDTTRALGCRVHLANIHQALADFPRARGWIELDHRRAAGAPERLMEPAGPEGGSAVHEQLPELSRIWSLWVEAKIARGEHALEEARRLLAEAFARSVRHGQSLMGAYVLTESAFVALDEGDANQAADDVMRALRVMRVYEDRTGLARCLEAVGAIATLRGDHRRAVRLAGAASSLRERLGLRPMPAEELLDTLWRERSRTVLPAEVAAAAWAEGEELSLDTALAEALADATAPPTSVDEWCQETPHIP